MEVFIMGVIGFVIITLLGLGVAHITGWDSKTVLLILYGILTFSSCLKSADEP